MDLEQALKTHTDWAQRLHDAASAAPSAAPCAVTGDGASAALDTARIASAQGCALGDWLDGEGRVRWGHRSEWQRCRHAHGDFHRAAGSVAAALNRGDHAAARAMLAAGTPFAGASRALMQALQALGRARDDGGLPPAGVAGGAEPARSTDVPDIRSQPTASA